MKASGTKAGRDVSLRIRKATNGRGQAGYQLCGRVEHERGLKLFFRYRHRAEIVRVMYREGTPEVEILDQVHRWEETDRADLLTTASGRLEVLDAFMAWHDLTRPPAPPAPMTRIVRVLDDEDSPAHAREQSIRRAVAGLDDARGRLEELTGRARIATGDLTDDPRFGDWEPWVRLAEMGVLLAEMMAVAAIQAAEVPGWCEGAADAWDLMPINLDRKTVAASVECDGRILEVVDHFVYDLVERPAVAR